MEEAKRAELTDADRERIRSAVRQKPNRMTLQLAKELGVPEVEVIRAFPDGRAVELDAGRWEELLRALEDLGAVHAIVSSGAATLEVEGRFGGFSTVGEFFNVQTPSLDMHIRWRELGAAFAVEKPGHLNGVNTLSFQFYDRKGDAALKVFLNFGNRPAPERQGQFAGLRERFRKGCPRSEAREQLRKLLLTLSVHSEEDYRKLTERERFLWDVFWFETEVINGGIDQYFGNSAGNHALETIEALRRIGATRTEALLREACKFFPEGGPSPEREIRREQMESFPGRWGDKVKVNKHAGWNERLQWQVEGVVEDLSELLLRYWNRSEGG